MMGDRDYRQLIKNAIDSIGREVEPKIDPKDVNTINIHEVVRCLRRSYFDRVEPKEVERRGFNDLVGGLLQSRDYGSKSGEFEIDELKLKGQAEMIVDDVILIFRSANELPDNPKADDLLYLNSCLWIYNKMEGILIYLTGDRKETSFSLTRDKKMFEEVVRRVRVFNDLLKQKKIPILEPSDECSTCQYYEKCFIKQKISQSISLKDIVGFKKN
jgi:CRISPR-associated exonuclease Cas4